MKSKNIVLFCDKGYHELALNTIESFSRVKDEFTFYYYTVDFTPKVPNSNVKVIPIDKPQNLPDIMLLKPVVIQKTLELVQDLVYVDCDLIASKHFNYDKFVSKVTHVPHSPLLHNTEWQFPIYYWYEGKTKHECNELPLMEFLGVKNRTQKWTTACMMAVTKNCKKFIDEYVKVCFTSELWSPKDTPKSLKQKSRKYFHIGDEGVYNTLLWKYGIKGNYTKGIVLEPKEASTFVTVENTKVLNQRLEPSNAMTECVDSTQVYAYHQLKDLKFRKKVLNMLSQDSSKKFLLVCSFYNNPEEHIDLTFNNVLSQTHQNWILIVGDDFSSTPGFRGLLKRKVEEINDPRIIYYETQKKRELYLYQNTFQELEYDYFFDLDSDDILHERTLELYNNNFKKYPEVTSIFSDYIRVSETGAKEQYSVVNPPKDYIEEFEFRDNSSLDKVYSKRSGQQMFGHARCMRKPTEDKIYIEKNCRTSTDSLFLFYNLNRGKHLHLPRRLYTYINHPGSDSSKMSSEEHADFNTNAKYYIEKLKTSNNRSPFNPYKPIWLETSALSTCDFLPQVDSLSIISSINNKQFELLKSLYPEKDLQLNKFDHPNLVVAWDGLSSNSKIELKKVANQAENISICKFNEDFTLNPENIFDEFNIENNSFVNSISKFLSGYTWYNYFRFVIITKQSFPNISFIPKIQPPEILDKFLISFINGAKVTIKGDSDKKYLVKFIDNQTKKLVWEDTISPGMWTKPSIEYFVEWNIEIYCNNKLVHHHIFDCNSKKVYIHLDSKSLGDTLAWFPYVEEFKKYHKCKVVCSTFKNFFFQELYPEIEFVEPGTTVHGIYAQFNIGWFYDSSKNPNLVTTIPLQQTASDTLGLKFKEIKPQINLGFNPSSITGKYVTLAIQSTAQAKYWNYKGGWQQVVNYLNDKGYKVVCIDQHSIFGVKGCMNVMPKNVIDKTGCNLEEAASLIKGANFHLGISSGLSWLSWALGTHVVMVSSFSNPICEFALDCTRIYTESKFAGYYNNPEYTLDPKNWHWNPFLDISTPEEWHDFETITPEQVINEIKQIL